MVASYLFDSSLFGKLFLDFLVFFGRKDDKRRLETLGCIRRFLVLGRSHRFGMSHGGKVREVVCHDNAVAVCTMDAKIEMRFMVVSHFETTRTKHHTLSRNKTASPRPQHFVAKRTQHQEQTRDTQDEPRLGFTKDRKKEYSARNNNLLLMHKSTVFASLSHQRTYLL